MQIPHPTLQASVGLGLRRGLMKDLQAARTGDFDFLEVAPENWIGVGGAHGAALRELAERYPLSCHGLSLSLGGSAGRRRWTSISFGKSGCFSIITTCRCTAST